MENPHSFSWDWIGLVAGSLTTISFVPQVIKVWKSKSADDLSVGMFLAFSAGVLCWLGYGIVKEDIPVIVANAMTFTLSISILVMKFVYDREKRSIKSASDARSASKSSGERVV